MFATLLLTLTAQTAWAGTVTLTSGTSAVTLNNGDELTGTGGMNTHVTIADGATVTLNNVTINVVDNSNKWAGITCEGDAIIVLAGGSTNTVKGFHNWYPGIYVPENKTLTIRGDGSLNASSNGSAAGIGANLDNNCGNIIIEGGNITATGGSYAAGIGAVKTRKCGDITISGGTINATGGMSGAGIGAGLGDNLNSTKSTCGNITISGGTITAAGGSSAAGIGTGEGYNSSYKTSICGNITITGGTISATKGSNAEHSIGVGKNGTCGTVTIGGVVGCISESPYNQTIVAAHYTVKFDNNGGTGTMSDQTINRGVATPLTRNTFTKDGYVFIGWSETADGDVAYTDCKKVTDLAEKDGTKTLYAKWMSTSDIPSGLQVDAEYAQTEAGFYYVNMPTGNATTNVTISDVNTKFKIYDDGGKNGNYTAAVGGYVVITVPEGYKVSIDGTATFSGDLHFYDANSVDNNKSCGGWANTHTGSFSTISTTGRYMMVAFSTQVASAVQEGLDLTATIAPITYTVSFNANATEGISGSMEDQTFTYGEGAKALTANAYTRTGYTFAGWATTADGNVVYADGAEVSNLATTQGANIELFAKWKKLLTNGDITVDAIADQTYTGSEIKPAVTMKDGETLLTENTDYTLSYSANTNVGEATVTITGAGNYAGTKTATFTINRKAVTITADSDSKEYDGTALTKNTFTTTDLEVGDTHAFTVTMTAESTITNVGSTANVIATVDGVAVTTGTPTAVGNYMVTTANGTLTINKKTVSTDGAIEVTQDENGYYATFSGSVNDAVSITEPITVKGVTLERSFANGKYATLMLPFSLNANYQTGQTLTGANIYQFVGVEKVSGQWIATMQTPTSPLQANTPYLVEPVTSDLTTDGYLTFGLNGGTVTLQTAASAEGSTNSDWQFVGTYTRLTYKADGSANLTGNIYGFASKDKTVDGVDVTAGEFVKAKDGAAVPPLRCYLTYKNGAEYASASARRASRSAEEELPQSIIVRLVGTNGETTNVMTIDTRTGEISTDGWYSIDGVKLSGKPTTKGLYINNGRKVVIK